MIYGTPSISPSGCDEEDDEDDGDGGAELEGCVDLGEEGAAGAEVCCKFKVGTP